MTLKTQPTKLPTRKMFAVILATFIVQGVVGVAEHYAPGMAESLPASEWVAALVPLFAGYMTREKA